jgi:NADP-dependent 3-hydroxy acid dehydrogenase YdfG
MDKSTPYAKGMSDETMTEPEPIIKDGRFLNKVVVITGAGGTFGREGCLFFAKRGAKVAALEVNAAALAETVALMLAPETNCCPEDHICALECNVTSAESIRNAMEEIIKKFGTIDMLWNNAGYQGEIKPTLEYDPQDFARVMDINVTGMFIVLQAAARHMATQDSGGSIVNTASVAGLRGTPAMVAYVSSKAAVLGMTGEFCNRDYLGCKTCDNRFSNKLITPSESVQRQHMYACYLTSFEQHVCKVCSAVQLTHVNKLPSMQQSQHPKIWLPTTFVSMLSLPLSLGQGICGQGKMNCMPHRDRPTLPPIQKLSRRGKSIPFP